MSIVRILRCLALFTGFLTASTQDVVGSTGCTQSACVLANSRLRFGTGSENSVNAAGLFQQPWYYSQITSAWYKLTFANFPLDTAIGTGTGSPNWSGANIVDLYSLTPTMSMMNYSGFVVDSSDATKTVGHGIIISSRGFVVSGQQIIVQNTFSLGLNDSFVKIVTRITNNATAALQNAILWTGTRDDFVGNTDVNLKTRGNLVTGSFVPITASSESSRAIKISNADEGVLFYSETPGVMTAYSMCCSFSNAYNAYPLALAPATPSATDGSYAAILPLGNISVGESASITWYYAAGSISSLSAVAQSVAEAQVADAGPPVDVPTASSYPSPFSVWSYSASASVSRSAVSTRSLMASRSTVATGSAVVSSSPLWSMSSAPSGSAGSTAVVTASAGSSPTVSAVATATGTATATATGTATATATGTTSMSSTNTPSAYPAQISYVVGLQIPTNFVADIIAINVASVAFSLTFLSLILFAFYRRYIYKVPPKTCSHCKKTLKDETIDEHLQTCEPYMDVVMRQANPYRNTRMRQAFTEVTARA
jgi:hypothetical protein